MWEREFFRAAGNFLYCRLVEMDENHKDHVGAFIGSYDWQSEMKLILEDWKNGIPVNILKRG